jgi:hypothetical protein
MPIDEDDLRGVVREIVDGLLPKDTLNTIKEGPGKP